MSGKTLVGYAHGASGIADALLDLFEVAGGQHYFDAALCARNWLRRLAVAYPVGSDGLNWPRTEVGEMGLPTWCNGAAGVGRLFMHLARLGRRDGELEFAERAGLAVAAAMGPTCPIQCHGLAGAIDYLLDLHWTTGKRIWLTEAQRLGRILAGWQRSTADGSTKFGSDVTGVFNADYMVGYAGVALTLLRLSDPDLSTQLSVERFTTLRARRVFLP
jgi:lantibiotic modifying enzyme